MCQIFGTLFFAFTSKLTLINEKGTSTVLVECLNPTLLTLFRQSSSSRTGTASLSKTQNYGFFTLYNIYRHARPVPMPPSHMSSLCHHFRRFTSRTSVTVVSVTTGTLSRRTTRTVS